MNRHSPKHNQTLTTVAGAIAGLLAMSTASPVYATDFHQNALFSPSQGLLKAEQRGRVMIYDGMHNQTVELAMNTQFDRIESMMFVNTLHAQPDGEVVADDDCD